MFTTAPVTADATVMVEGFNTPNPNFIDNGFRRCFDWDAETNTFSGGDQWWHSDACAEWRRAALWPVVVVTLLAVFFVLYPVVFAISKYVFNCCGGRKPSYDCCCPSRDATATFKGYTRCTRVFTRLMYAFGTAALIFVSVLIFVNIAAWRTDTDTLADKVRSSGDALDATIDAAHYDLALLHNGGSVPSFINRSSVALFAAATAQFRNAEPKLQSSHPIRIVGASAAYTSTAVGLVLLLAVLGLVLSACSATGLPMTIVACLFSVASAIVAGVLVTWLAMDVTTAAACRNFDAVVVPAAIGGLQLLGACNTAAAKTLSTEVAAAFYRHLLIRSSPETTAFCTAAHSLSVSLSVAAPCAAADPIAATNALATAARTSALLSPIFKTSPFTHAAAFVAFAAASDDCSAVRVVVNRDLAPLLCLQSSSVATDTTQMTALLSGLVAVCGVTLFALVRGIKRFGNAKPKDGIDAADDEQLLAAAAPYGTFSAPAVVVIGEPAADGGEKAAPEFEAVPATANSSGEHYQPLNA